MGKVRMQCPSCGAEVELGDIECKHCGVNLKSGETFEARMRQAKGRATHPELFAARVYFGVTVALTLLLFAGFMYQRGMEGTIILGDRLPVEGGVNAFRYAVDRMDWIDGRVSAGDEALKKNDYEEARQSYGNARRELEELAKWLDSVDESILLEDPYAHNYDMRVRHHRLAEPERPYNKRAAKRLLRTLKAKVLSRMERVPQLGLQEAPMPGVAQ